MGEPFSQGKTDGRRWYNRLSLVLRGIDIATAFAFRISALLLLAITLLYCMEIVLRYFFLTPTLWSRDTVTYLLCAMLMLAAPKVAQNNAHVAITLLVENLRSGFRHFAERSLALVTALISFAVAYITALETVRLFEANILTLGTIAVPKWWIMFFVPVGFTLVALQFLSLALIPSRLADSQQTQV